jgi:hypothetical protein
MRDFGLWSIVFNYLYTISVLISLITFDFFIEMQYFFHRTITHHFWAIQRLRHTHASEINLELPQWLVVAASRLTHECEICFSVGIDGCRKQWF